MQVISAAVFLLVPVVIGWRISFFLLKQNPTPAVKLFFWLMSALFIGLAATVFVATRYI